MDYLQKILLEFLKISSHELNQEFEQPDLLQKFFQLCIPVFSAGFLLIYKNRFNKVSQKFPWQIVQEFQSPFPDGPEEEKSFKTMISEAIISEVLRNRYS